MKLADYLEQAKVSPAIVRRELGVTHTAFRRYLTGERIPSAHLIQKIIEISHGAVQLADFLDRSPPKCGVVIKLPNGKSRVVLPWNNRDKDLDACIAVVKAEPDEALGDTPPVQRALEILGRRVKPTGKGLYLLDGRPVDLRSVIAAANRLLEVWGQEPIPYPGVLPKVKP